MARPLRLELARYIGLNPVRARMVYTAEEWPWSSYRGTIGLQALPEGVSTDWILASFGESRDKAIPCYKRFVQEGRDQPSSWEGLKNQVYLGSDAFVAQMVGKLDGQEKLSEIPAIQKRRVAQPLADFESTTPNRNSAIGAYNLKEIADHFEPHRSSVIRMVRAARCKT